jgi:hypothetical protein
VHANLPLLFALVALIAAEAAAVTAWYLHALKRDWFAGVLSG